MTLTPSIICIALAVYFEARNQPIEGQFAVAHVIQNRTKSPRWPDTPCKVVYQHKQFSFFSDGKSDIPLEPKAWDRAKKIALASTLIPDTTHGATHYIATYATASWQRQDRLVAIIGDHKFYRLQRGE